MLRRQFLQSLPLYNLPFVEETTPTIEVGLYLSKYARDEHGSSTLNSIAHTVDNIIQRNLGDGYDYYIGPHTIIDVPSDEKGSAQQTLDWWMNQGDYTHSNLLVLTAEETSWPRYDGYAKNNHCVMRNYEFYANHDWENYVASHEVGHNLGADHEHADVFDDTATIMYSGGTRKNRMNYYSDEAIKAMKENL